MQEVLINEELIATILQNHPEADKKDNNQSADKFQLNKNTRSTCIDFLRENDVDISAWIGEADENERIKKILMVWFTIFSSYNKEPWCTFPEIVQEDNFYPNAKIVLLTEA